MTVIHLACGFDSRYFRVRKGRNVKWIDVDQPTVVNLRSRLDCLKPDPGADYTLRTLQIDTPKWARDLPNDRPTLVVAEGLLMYLEPAQVQEVLRETAAHFGQGELVFDSLNWMTQFLTSWVPALRPSGSVWKWGVDDVASFVEALHPKLRLRERRLWDEYSGSHPPLFGPVCSSLVARLPSHKYSCAVNRFEF